MKKIILSFCLFLITIITLGQVKITGVVLDEADQPIEGASVTVLQSLEDVYTNSSGVYEIEAPKALTNITLEFTRFGYSSVLKNVQLNQEEHLQTFNVSLEETAIELEDIVVTAGFAKEKDKLPYVISTISQKDLITSGKSNLSQNLAEIPGVYSINFGNGVGKPVVRGLTNANLILLNDGIKQENFQFSASHPFLIDEFSAKSIEVIKGPMSLQYGSDAVGGVINTIRERPASINTIQGNFGANYHTNTHGLVSSLGVKGSGENLFWGLRGSLKSHQDFSDGDDNDVYNTRFNENSFGVDLGTRSNFGRFAVSYDYTRPKYGIQNKGSQNLINNFANLLEDGSENQVWYQNLTNHFIASNNTIYLNKNTLDINLGYQSNLREANGGVYSPQQQALVIPTYASMQLNTFTYNAKLSVPLNQNKMIFGFNGANISNEADEDKPNNPLVDSKVNDIGIYAIGDFAINNQLITTVGLRYDYRNMTSDPVATQNTDRFKVDNNYNSIAGSLGMVYNFDNNHFLKANMSSGYRSPTIPELTQNGIHSGRFERGDTNLKAQRNYQFDLNYHIHKSWLTIDVSPFYNKINDYIYVVMSTENAPIGDGKVFQHVQNDANLYGGEFAIDMHPNQWLAYHSSFSLIRADLTDSPLGIEHPTFTPQDRWTNELILQLPNINRLKKPYLSVEFMHFFEQNKTGQNEAVTPAYNLLNMKLGTQIAMFKRNADIFISGFNLTNETYIDHLSFTKQLGLNMMGRNIVFGINIPFTVYTKKL